MTNDKGDCVAKPRIYKLAKNALKEINKIEKHQIPKELELDLNKIEKDLNDIIMDNHKPHPQRPVPRPPRR